MSDAWGGMSASGLYGLRAGAAPEQLRGHTPALGAIAGPGVHNGRSPAYSPQNPVFWAVALVAATLGLAGFSVSGRVGPVKAGADLGKT